jgi:cation diffusion facilitator family transporter
MDAGNRKAVLTAMAANAGIAVAKFVGFSVTGATSLLAEGVHSVADTGNQGLLLWGGSAAARRATPDHPFGYGRERFFWAFVVALVIFSLGGLFAMSEGIEKLRHPHPLRQPIWAVGILIFGILLEGNSFRIAVRQARRQKGDFSWWAFVRRTKNPEIAVILLEDLGALFGLALALVGVGLAMSTGDARWDAVGSIAIGILLLAIGALLAYEMKSLLIGEGAYPGDVDAMQRAIEAGDDVERVIHLRTQYLGPDELLLGAKVEFRRGLDLRELADAIDAAEARVRARVPKARVIYLEPDVFRNPSPSEVRAAKEPS